MSQCGPDLTLNDKNRQRISGGLTPDNGGVEYAGTIFAIAESRLKAGLIWAGTNDGLIHVTRDGGQNWTNVTANIPDLPPWGTVSNIEPSRHSAGTAYVTVDFHQVNNRDPYVYRTRDYGETWESISATIPRSPLSYTHCVREDPVRPGLLYLGTENSLYVSLDDGESWMPLQTNLPHAPVHWLVIQEHFNDLVVGTYGRGFWILDDITPLQQVNQEILDSEAHLFQPRPAYRYRFITEPWTFNNDPSEGNNPPYGASIHYYLKSEPKDDVKITVLDSQGRTVRTFDGTKDTGINRVWWDLRYDRTTEIKLRTPPPHAPDVQVGPEGWRPFPDGGRLSVLAPPGKYEVVLKIGDRELRKELIVNKDPNTSGTAADIDAQTKVLLEIAENLDTAARSINQIESIRAQLLDLTRRLGSDSEYQSVRTAAEDLEKRLVAIEEDLFQIKVTGRGQDQLRWPAQLVSKLLHLASGLGVGDFPPTDEQLQVHEYLGNRTRVIGSQLQEAVSRDLEAFNTMLRERGIPNILGSVP